MRTIQDLSHTQLDAIASLVQQALFLDVDDKAQLIWNPDKSWEGAEICDQLAAMLRRLRLAPSRVVAANPDAARPVVFGRTIRQQKPTRLA